MKLDGKLKGRALVERAARIDVRYNATVQWGGEDIAAQILNLSARGFRLRTFVPLEAGQNVLLAVPKFPPVRAIVHWVDGKESGGVFLDPVAL